MAIISRIRDCRGCHCFLSIAMLPMRDKKKGAVKWIKEDKDPVSQSGDKTSKKRSKGCVQDKLHHLLLFDKATHDQLC
ncbi:hypothetical protein U0070_015748 [Myodes glareolus]|uniref:40S ribosomal protein S25 n=1 Tax=Myodes glareolus TaxID=447135 RepID=A0AAW0I677_MYOGA